MSTQGRLESLPFLTEEHDVARSDVVGFRRDGHVVLRAVASLSEVAAYRPHIAAAVESYKKETRPMAERDTYGKAFIQVWELKEYDEVVRRFVLGRRFAKIAADLMGVDGVRIFNDQALFKEPGGGYTPWHQDHPYWPIDTDHMVTLWMPLVDVSPEMGSMEFASGSHKARRIDAFDPTDVNAAISDQTQQFFDSYMSDHGLVITGNGAMSAGDASLHDGWILHRAEGNATSNMREVMTIIYMADGARTVEADNPGAEEAYEVELVGLKPGDPAAGLRNPLVFSRMDAQ